MEPQRSIGSRIWVKSVASKMADCPNIMQEKSPLRSVRKEVSCPICGALAEKHHIHYGGMACFSCRAFFRRAHEKTRRPQYMCKSDDRCVISVQSRRKCAACRYKLCLKVGMDPNWVLTEDQKKARFRKYLEKKKRAEHSEMSDASSCRTNSPDSVASHNNNNDDTMDDHMVETECSRLYNHACRMVRPTANLMAKGISLHMGTRKPNEVDLEELNELFGNRFKHFAGCQREFTNLSVTDQSTLLAHNIPLFIQLMICHYLSLRDSRQQIKLLFQGLEDHLPNLQHSDIICVDYDYIERELLTAQDSPFFQLYKFVATLCGGLLNQGISLPLLIQVILFRPLDSTQLEDPAAIVTIWKRHVMNLGRPVLEVRNIVVHLRTMLCLFQSHMKMVSNEEKLRIIQVAEVSYTTFYQLIPHNFLRISSGYLCDWLERCLLAHSGFRELDPKDQKTVMDSNIPLAESLYWAKLSQCNTFRHQFVLVFGRQNAERLARSRKFEDVPRVEIFKRSVTRHAIHQRLQQRFDDLVTNISNLVSNPLVFRVVLLLQLCNPAGNEFGETARDILESISEFYMKLLKEVCISVYGPYEGVGWYSTIEQNWADIKELSDLTSGFLNNGL